MIRIKNAKKANSLFELLQELPYVEIQKVIKSTTTNKKQNPAKPEDLKKYFGVWENENITLKELRKKAWKR